jgi:RpiB/LacA/LacB family sugar-phosphate isomerase
VDDLEVYIGSDHHGVYLKKAIVDHLTAKNIKIHDFGTYTTDSVDYPDVAKEVCQAVKAELENHRGILICASGVGMCMAANRIPGILAGQVWSEEMAKRVREDDNINVLCLGADYLPEELSLRIIDKWLETDFSYDDRHVRRILKITEMD